MEPETQEPEGLNPMQLEMCQKLLDLLPPDEQVRAVNLAYCDELKKSWRLTVRKRKLEEEREKQPEEETEKKLKKEPETVSEAEESEAEDDKKHEEEQETQLEHEWGPPDTSQDKCDA